jgi:hypothetical protein
MPTSPGDADLWALSPGSRSRQDIAGQAASLANNVASWEDPVSQRVPGVGFKEVVERADGSSRRLTVALDLHIICAGSIRGGEDHLRQPAGHACTEPCRSAQRIARLDAVNRLGDAVT